MSLIRRICLYAGPGSGKSVMASTIYSCCSKNDKYKNKLRFELVNEYAKNWAYENRYIKGWKQAYVYSKQMYKEFLPLSSGADIIITDSPLYLSCVYAQKYNTPGNKELVSLSHEFEKDFPALHIFVNRENNTYIKSGRFEEYDQAVKIDNEIIDFLNINNINFQQVLYKDEESVLAIIDKNINIK